MLSQLYVVVKDVGHWNPALYHHIYDRQALRRAPLKSTLFTWLQDKMDRSKGRSVVCGSIPEDKEDVGCWAAFRRVELGNILKMNSLMWTPS